MSNTTEARTETAKKVADQPKIAFLFRYGPADNVELTHATPWILKQLARCAEIHYFSPQSHASTPACMREHTTLHTLPYTVNRSSSTDKLLKTILWYLVLPFIGLRCRGLGVRLVYIDDFLPLGGWIMRVFSGAHTAIFVVDFLLDAYAEKHPLLRPALKTFSALDAASWKKASLVFTRTLHGQTILKKHRVPQKNIRTVYDACDMELYHPILTEDPRRAYGYTSNEIVLSHHGVLHPNKGIDSIIGALPPLMEKHPNFRFLCIGSGPEEDALRAQVDRLGITDKVVFTGWLASARDVNVALNASDIGLVMRIGEAADHFHITGALVHSMAVGLPVLAPRLAGIQEVVHEDQTGYLFEPSDMNEFTEHCDLLITDKTLRQRLGEAALDVAKKEFDVERAANTVVHALLEKVSS